MEVANHHVISSDKSPQEGDGVQTGDSGVVVMKSAMNTLFQLPDQQQRWDPERHTVQSDPDTYGTIIFDGFGQEASRKAPVNVWIYIFSQSAK